jgi:isopenicillin N synthase-like dioxygenase
MSDGFLANGASIPVIDLCAEKPENLLAQEVIETFKTLGFATLINHGVATATIEKGFAASKAFFEMPLETKRKYKYVSHETNRGYIQPGLENHKTTDMADERKETFDIGKEGEAGYNTPWPQELAHSGFKEDLLQYFQEFNLLNLRLMRLIAIGLGLSDHDYLVSRCDGQHCNLRLLHYLELARTVKGTTIQRGARHTDYGSITLLCQVHTQHFTGKLVAALTRWLLSVLV